MPEPAPLLSVIVPTRARVSTLPFTLATILHQQTRSFEVIVSDNCSEDGTRDAVRRIADDRVTYLDTGERLTMTDNWEFAIRHARGRYVLFVGDDDAILPGALDRLEPFLAGGSASILTWPLLFYRWPMDGAPASASCAPGPAAPVTIDVRRRARFAMRMGSWLHYTVPTIYHSAFHRSLVETMRQRTGRVFHTMTPDVFAGFAAAALTRHALSVGFAVTVSGASAQSNSGRMMEAGAISAAGAWNEHLSEYADHGMHPSLYPGVPVRVNTIPNALLVARDLFPEAYAAEAFGYSEMWAFLLRTRDVCAWDARASWILAERHRIRRYHPFSVSRFAAAGALHKAIAITRPLRRRRQMIRGGDGVPPDIAGFVMELGRAA
jgi:glycosyltransferase involved in cell wall biosynthesis